MSEKFVTDHVFIPLGDSPSTCMRCSVHGCEAFANEHVMYLDELAKAWTNATAAVALVYSALEEALRPVVAALNTFYDGLTDEQKKTIETYRRQIGKGGV